MWEYELYHHGILGMKWGIRRYQNTNGSLTSTGKKRRKTNDTDEPSPSKHGKVKEEKKKVSDMSDDELRTMNNRLRLEKEAYDLQSQISKLNPRKVSLGERFIKSLAGDVLAPAAKNIGKSYLEKMLKDKLGLSESNKDVLADLKKEVAGKALMKQKIELDKFFTENK